MSIFRKSILMAASVAITTLGVAQSSQAGTLHNSWNYGIDAFGDGSGGSVYDLKGLAIKETNDSVFIAITGGLGLEGKSHSGAADGNVGHGDLFFNFTGEDFQTASDQGDLFGVRFAGTNDSGVSQVGVYENVSAESVTLDNVGYKSSKKYYEKSGGKYDVANTMGTDLASKEAVYDYLYDIQAGDAVTHDNTKILNVIDSGDFLGGLQSLDLNQLTEEGLDFGHFNANGSKTVGFKFDRSFLPGGEFFAHLFIECGNDGIALSGDIKDVPEPSAMAGLTLLGLVFSGAGLRKKRKLVG